MDHLEIRLQKRIHVSLYALLFLTVLLAISFVVESCHVKREVKIGLEYNRNIAYRK